MNKLKYDPIGKEWIIVWRKYFLYRDEKHIKMIYKPYLYNICKEILKYE